MASARNFSCQLPVAYLPSQFPDYPRTASLNPYCKEEAKQEYGECVQMCNGNESCGWYCQNQLFFNNAGCSSVGGSQVILGARACTG